mgnify:CR=1 FL=1
METFTQHLGTADDLADLVLTAGCLRLGLADSGVGSNRRPFIRPKTFNNRLDATENRKVLALVTQPCQAGVKVLEVDEKALLGDGDACHGVCSFRCVQVGYANPLTPDPIRWAGAVPRDR